MPLRERSGGLGLCHKQRPCCLRPLVLYLHGFYANQQSCVLKLLKSQTAERAAASRRQDRQSRTVAGGRKRGARLMQSWRHAGWVGADVSLWLGRPRRLGLAWGPRTSVYTQRGRGRSVWTPGVREAGEARPWVKRPLFPRGRAPEPGWPLQPQTALSLESWLWQRMRGGAGRPAHPSRCPPAEDTRRSSFQDQTEGSFVSGAWEKQIPHSRGHLQGARNVNRAEAGERSPWATAPMLLRSREPDTAGSIR